MKKLRNIIKTESDKEKEIASLKALLANPDPARVAEYEKLGISYVNMLKGKLAELGDNNELEEEEEALQVGDKVLVKNANKYDAFAPKFVHGTIEAISTDGSKIDIKRMGDLEGNPPQKTYQGSVGSLNNVDAEDVILDTSGEPPSSLKLRALIGEDLKEAAGDFGTAVAQVEDIAAWIEANTDVELGPDRATINKYARDLSDRLMAGR